AQERRLAAAARTQDADGFAGGDAEGNIAQHRQAGEGAMDVLRAQQGSIHGRAAAPVCAASAKLLSTAFSVGCGACNSPLSSRVLSVRCQAALSTTTEAGYMSPANMRLTAARMILSLNSGEIFFATATACSTLSLPWRIVMACCRLKTTRRTR